MLLCRMAGIHEGGETRTRIRFGVRSRLYLSHRTSQVERVEKKTFHTSYFSETSHEIFYRYARVAAPQKLPLQSSHLFLVASTQIHPIFLDALLHLPLTSSTVTETTR